MPQFTFYVSESGRLPQGIASTLTARLKELANKKCTIKLEEAKDNRSLDANAFLWGVVYETIRQFHLDQGSSYTIEQIHESCLEDFSPKVEIRLIDGSTKLVPKRSKHMTVEEFHKYILAIEVRLNEFSIYFPAHKFELIR